MDAGRLHRLGKRLIELSRAATTEATDPQMTPGELAVLEHLVTNPDSSVSDLSARTGFAQSHVSNSVARLRHRGLVDTIADPSDGRRTKVQATNVALQAITNRAGRGVQDAIAAAVPDAEKARQVTVKLDELAQLLL
jgi:DNA-binding MarR family transcriptional regulator